MKTLEQLEKEAKQAREGLKSQLTEICGWNLASPLADKIIETAVAMVTYQFALAGQEEKQSKINIKIKEAKQTVICKSNFDPSAIPTEWRQEEPDSDGWIEWDGESYDCPILEHVSIDARFASGDINSGDAGQFRWHHVGNRYDLIAYRIVKGE